MTLRLSPPINDGCTLLREALLKWFKHLFELGPQ
jgi:hypothetical protein